MKDWHDNVRFVLLILITICNGIALIGYCWNTPYRDVSLWVVGTGLGILFLVAAGPFVMDFIYGPVYDAIWRIIDKIENIYTKLRSKR